MRIKTVYTKPVDWAKLRKQYLKKELEIIDIEKGKVEKQLEELYNQFPELKENGE